MTPPAHRELIPCALVRGRSAALSLLTTCGETIVISKRVPSHHRDRNCASNPERSKDDRARHRITNHGLSLTSWVFARATFTDGVRTRGPFRLRLCRLDPIIERPGAEVKPRSPISLRPTRSGRIRRVRFASGRVFDASPGKVERRFSQCPPKRPPETVLGRTSAELRPGPQGAGQRRWRDAPAVRST